MDGQPAEKKDSGLNWKIFLSVTFVGGLYLFLGHVDAYMITLSLAGIIFIFLLDFFLHKAIKDEKSRILIIIVMIILALRFLSPLLKNLFSDGSIAV